MGEQYELLGSTINVTELPCAPPNTYIQLGLIKWLVRDKGGIGLRCGQ